MKNQFIKSLIFIFLFLLLQRTIYSQNIYVSATGNDSNTGSKENPLLTISTAINQIKIGDTIFVRGGTYNLNSTINISKSGESTSMYNLFAYNKERVVLNFAAVTVGTKGIKLNANYWYIKGINVTKAGHNGIGITGSYNIIEHCEFFENRNSGMQLDNGASNNRIINCDSYYNFDGHNNGADADGFAPKLTIGTGNYFYGCRSWTNSDDGWDGYMRGANDVTTTLENCWTFGNGYTKEGTDPGAQANGNGFKMGGGDNSNSLRLMHHFILKNCLAFDNKVKGFDQNNNDGSMTLINCTGFNNKSANYKITRQVNQGQNVFVQNSVSFTGSVDLGSFVQQVTNSWMNPFVVTKEDFLSIDTTGVRGKRKPDGSLPDVNFMKLAAGSDLIDGGTDVGLPYLGKAPDLGAFEFNPSTNIEHGVIVPEQIVLKQNYPNPFNPETKISFSISPSANSKNQFYQNVSLKIYDQLGREIATLLNEQMQPGNYEVHFNSKTVSKSNLTSGIYFYQLVVGSSVQTKKMILLK